MAKKTARQAISYSRQCSENLKAIIAEAKVRRHLTDEGIAKAMGMPLSSFTFRKSNPGRFRLEDIWLLCQVLEIPHDQIAGVVIGEKNENV